MCVVSNLIEFLIYHYGSFLQYIQGHSIMGFSFFSQQKGKIKFFFLCKYLIPVIEIIFFLVQKSDIRRNHSFDSFIKNRFFFNCFFVFSLFFSVTCYRFEEWAQALDLCC